MPKFTGSRLRSAGYRGFNFHLFSSITVAIALFSVFCIQYSGVAQAAPGINQQINFQGRLLNTDGSAVADGSHTVVFSLYTTSSGGSNIWTESQSVTTTKGLFRVSLGSVSSLANVDFNQDTLYLGIKVGSDLEMTPRLLFNAAPYAFMAETATLALNATTVDGLSVANGKTLAINNSLTFSGTDGTTFTLPSSSGTLVSTDANQTLSNKTVNGLVASGTLTISGLTTNGGIIYTNGSGVVAQTAAGNAGQCLQSNGSGAPTWASCGDSIGPDSLNFDDFADSLTLDATTDIAIGSGLALSTSGEGSVAFNHTGDTTFASNIGLGVSDASAARLTVKGDSDAVTYGSELITNGSFTGSSTGWTFFSGWSHDATNDEMDHTPGSATYIYQSPSKTVGSMYRVTYTLKNVSAGSLTASFGDQTDTVRTANGTYVFDARVLNTNTLDFTPSSDFNGSLDDVSVVEIISSPILALFKKSNDAAALEFRVGGTALGNSFIGIASGSSNTTGGQNTGLGYSALSSTTTGALNTSVGYHAMRINSTGSRNTGLGSFALYSNLNGSRNTGIGSDTLRNMSNGNYNTAIGSEAGYYNETGSNNVYLGRQAGYGSSGQSQTGNIFIGYQAGYNETGSNLLYIENSSSSTPLIKGDFAADALTFNGSVTITNGLTLSGGTLSLPNNSVTDAMVSNTLTSSIFIGSGSSTNAVDLGTAEVAGTLSIARGGTNSTDTPTAGGIAYGTGSAFAFTSAGSAGQCLQSNGSSAPTWGSCGDLVTDDGAFSYLTSTTDDFILGASTVANAALHMDVSAGNLYLGTDGALNGGLYFYSSTAGKMATIFTDSTGNLNLSPATGGSVVVGGGNGNIELSLGIAADVFIAEKQVGSLSGAYSLTDYTFKRTLTGGANSIGGKVFSIVDNSSTSTTNNPDMLHINAAPSSGTFTGNLINAQVGGVSKFMVNSSGAVTVTDGLILTGGILRTFNPQGQTVAPTRSNDGEFAFAEVSSTARLYAQINGADVYFNSDGAGDYSEYFLKDNYLAHFDIGTIMTLDSGKAKAAYRGSSVLGIVSAFGTRNNDNNIDGTRGTDPRYINVGLLGQLPVIVTNENGPIATGDLIAMPQQIAGAGVKATNAAGISRAQESFNPTNCANVGSMSEIEWPAEVRNENTSVNRCWTLPSGIKVGRIMTYLATSTVNTGTSSNSINTQKLEALLTALTLTKETVSTSLNFVVGGTLTANGGLKIFGPAEFNGPAIFKAMAEFIDSAIFRKPVRFEDHVAFSNDTVGTVKIAKGQDRATVTFSKAYANKPIINASLFDDKISAANLVEQIEANVCAYGDTLEQCQTKMQQNILTNNARYLITDIEPTGFTILLDGPAVQDYMFSWNAFASTANSP